MNMRSSKGMTLIEIMVVMAILGGILAVAAPRLFTTGNQMRSAVRKLAVMTRDMRNNARLYNVTTRLAITMDDDKGHSYNVESAQGSVLELTEDQRKDLERLTEAQREGAAKKATFEQETRVLKKPITLPRGLYFGGVEVARKTGETTSGTAYVQFLPQGLADEAVIYLTDRKSLNWTIAINPLTGRADVFERKLTLKEVRGQ